jgi:hypothetical protein
LITLTVTLAIVLASVSGYLWVGWRFVGPRYIVRALEKHIREWPSLCRPQDLARERRNVQTEAWLVMFIWPAAVLIWLITRTFPMRAPLTSLEASRKAEAQAARIAELERQLGIGTP